MKILIHAISTKMGGARRHLNNMVKSLADANTDHQFILLVNDEYDTSVFDEKIDTITFPTTYSSGVKRVILDNWHINKIIEERDIDILISFANFGPVKAKCKHILFEMNALFFCENIRHLYNKKQLLDFAVKRFLIKLSTIWADLTVTPSESLKHQIVKSLHVPEKKVEVLYHAIEHDFCEIEEPEHIFRNDRVSFLYPSHLARHKGVHILIDALVILRENRATLPPFEIICTFSRSDEPAYYDELAEKIKRYGLEEIVKFVGHVPQNRINSLYGPADYMIYTTLCESFGFSMLEAKAFKLPMLCSDIPINREIAKGSAKYYRSDDPRDLADKLRFFIEKKPDDFDFEDETLLGWNWQRYTDKLLRMIEETANG